MGIETLQTLSTIFYTLAGVLLLTSIILFFALKIPKAFGIYTGLSAARGIKKYQNKIQKENTVKETGRVNMTSSDFENTESPHTSKINPPAPAEENHTVILNDANKIHQPVEEPALPVENPDVIFEVVQELRFTSSTEIVE